MSRRTGRQSQGFATPRKGQITIVGIVVVSLFAAWTMLASSGAPDSAFKHKDKKDQTVSIANFNPNSPAKEYIFAGSKLVATEEPPTSPAPGSDTIGLFYDSAGGNNFFLRNSNTNGVADLTFEFRPGPASWVPITGDWNADGVDTIGVYNPATGNFYQYLQIRRRNHISCCRACGIPFSLATDPAC